MPYNKETLEKISSALVNTDNNITFYYDVRDQKVIEVRGKTPDKKMSDLALIEIEPMLDDLIELMEDFSLEQEAEDVQDYLYKILQHRDKKTAVINFKRVLPDYPKSKKKWVALERKWLKERAKEFLEDIRKQPTK